MHGYIQTNPGVDTYGNITKSIIEVGADDHDNLIATQEQLLEWFPNFTDGKTWEQYVPAPGSPAEGMGATNWIAELQGTAPPPDPDPEPEPEMDTLTLVAVTIDDPAMGTVSIVDNKVHYVPAEGYSGPVSGTYTAQDEAGQQSTTEWSGTVEATPNPPPLAVADHDAFSVPLGTTLVVIDVLANDFADTP
jgi:hypothetical protein